MNLELGPEVDDVNIDLSAAPNYRRYPRLIEMKGKNNKKEQNEPPESKRKLVTSSPNSIEEAINFQPRNGKSSDVFTSTGKSPIGTSKAISDDYHQS